MTAAAGPVARTGAFDAEEAALATRVLDDVAAGSADRIGVSRPGWSPTESRALDHIEAVARSEGLATWRDDAASLIMSLPEDVEASPYVLIGSHVDTVPAGGNFDGLAGVVAGLVCLVHARRRRQRFDRPVRVIAMRGEESAWFGPCYTASKALTGTLTADDLAARHRGDGRPLAEHMAALGLDPAALAEGRPLMDLGAVAEYLELHIEQGPLLAARGLAAAVVTGIRGNLRFKDVTCMGEAGHSGAVPRAFRHDPVMATAKLLARMDDIWSEAVDRGTDLVMTTGMIGTDPAHHAMARIADQVTFSFEIRSQSSDTLALVETEFNDQIARIEVARGVRFDRNAPIRNAPAMLDAAVGARLEEAMARAGQQVFTMASGGGHDAAIFANAGIPAGMVFVRSHGGSHNPDEAMETADLLAGAGILLAHIKAR